MTWKLIAVIWAVAAYGFLKLFGLKWDIYDDMKDEAQIKFDAWRKKRRSRCYTQE